MCRGEAIVVAVSNLHVELSLWAVLQASGGDEQELPFVPPAFHLLFSDSLTITMEENRNVLGLQFVFFID